MKYQIDQSGKIEHTSQVTVVAVANGRVKSIQIGAGEKQKLIKIMRVLDYPNKSYVLKIFAGLIFLLLRGEKISIVEIDKEYPGYEGIIKNMILQLYGKFHFKTPEILFVLVGKESKAHKIALSTFQKKIKADSKAKAENILDLFYTKKCWSSRSSRDNL